MRKALLLVLALLPVVGEAAVRPLIRPRAMAPVIVPLVRPMLKQPLFFLPQVTCASGGAVKIGCSTGGGGTGGGTPGGLTTQVQFNNAGAFGGDAGLTYNSGTDTLSVGSVTLGGVASTITSSAAGVFRLGVNGTSTQLSPTADVGGHTWAIWGVDISAASAAGNVQVRGGVASGSATAAGAVEMRGGTSAVAGVRAGSASIFGGSAQGSADSGGHVSIAGGTGSAEGGFVNITAGSGGVGAIVLGGTGLNVANSHVFDTSGAIIHEGATADAFEYTQAFGDPTADVTETVTASSVGLTKSLSAGIHRFGSQMLVSSEAPTTEAGGISVEFSVKNTAANTELHVEGGLNTGYAGFGARNELLTDGSGLTRSGLAILARGSTNASVGGGVTLSNWSTFTNAGADSAGLGIGTATIDPLMLFQQTVVGSEPRVYFAPTCFALTDGAAAAAFVRVDVPSGSLTAGHIDYAVYAFNGSGMQVTHGTAYYGAVNRAGTETCGIGDTLGVDLLELSTVEAGTLSVAFTSSNSPTNGCNFLMASDSSLTTPTMAICYSVYKLAGVGAINPL